jgi:hypothetical protein
MIFTFFITIVFIAELIIFLTIVCCVLKFDKKILKLNAIVSSLNPSIRQIMELVSNISVQIRELSKDFVGRFLQKRGELMINNIIKILLSSYILHKFKHFKFTKKLTKALSLLQFMV